MPVPHVSERIKEVPAQALRGVFAGIGQLLLITDKLRNKAPGDVPRARTPERDQPVAEATVSEPAVPQEKAAEPARTRDFDKTGNVRLVDGAQTDAAGAVGSEPGDSGPPLPNYDELSVASLRARLRNLDTAQVRQLAEYERAHAARADLIAMFERRIAKLEADAQ
jgi:hypothetical protein